MLRITEYIRDVVQQKESRSLPGSILIWNLTDRCNLRCRHCYASASNRRDGELQSEDFKKLIPQLREGGVSFAILSGGEPLMKEELFDVAREMKENGIGTYLSSNGTMINEDNIQMIKDHFDYVGISIDGKPHVHDRFRLKKGAFDLSLGAMRLSLSRGIKTGIRFTVTPHTYGSLPFIFELAEKEGIPKIYISHLVYSGRGGELTDISREEYRKVVDYIMGKAFEYVENDSPVDVVTGNNDADAIVLLREFSKRYPGLAGSLLEKLKSWGGNQAGVRLVNITYSGDVKPDPFFSQSLGNVVESAFSDIWSSNGLLSELREKPRRLKGKCGECSSIEICNGNSRVRAYASSGDYMEEDPACYI